MVLPKLMLLPDSAGYGDMDGNQVVSTQLDGGLPRNRRDKLNAAKTITVTWTMNPAQYQYWRAFYVSVTGSGADQFLCDLVSEDGTGPVEHTCLFVPGSVHKPGQQGLTYQQSAQLWAIPVPHDADIDASIVAIFETSLGEPDAWFAALDRLVTVVMPENISA